MELRGIRRIISTFRSSVRSSIVVVLPLSVVAIRSVWSCLDDHAEEKEE